MSEPDDDPIPQATAAPRKRWSLSLVWVIPLVAALIGGWVAVKAILERGPTITITFKTAEGLEAGQTAIKYKDVSIGVVQDIHLSPDRGSVRVVARMDKDAAPLLVEDTRFWVVRARVSAGQVSGLGTLLSGSYIGVDPGTSTQGRDDFVGLEVQPLVTGDQPGKQFVLHAEDLGSIDIGVPVFYRRLQVGSVVAYELDPEGKGVDLKIFVRAPYDRYVTADTRFWNASGIDALLSAEGLRVRTEGLSALLVGGIAFQTPSYAVRDQPPAAASARYVLHADRETALQKPVHEVRRILLMFDESVRGLAPGAVVEFMGVPIGEVRNVSLEYDAAAQDFRSAVDVDLHPERFWERVRGDGPRTREAGRAMIDSLVARGWRAQLRSGNLITGQLYVAFDFFTDAPKVAVNWAHSPPEFPTQPGDLQALQTTLRTLAHRVDKLPLDQIGAELNKALTQTALLTERLNAELAPQASTMLKSVQQAVDRAEHTMLNAEAPLQQDMSEALRELRRAAESLRVLTEYLERHPESLVRGKPEDE